MNNKNFNTAFFSYEGQINRKDYAINMLILIGLFIALSLIKPEVFVLHTSLKFLAVILSFAISLVRFVVSFSILSQIYRRINDITRKNSYKNDTIWHKFFIGIYIVPIILYFIIGFLIGNTIPIISSILDGYLLIMMPLMIIYAIILGFVKGQ